MKFKDRLKVFAFGALLGGIIVAYIKAKRGDFDRPREVVEAPQTAEEIQREVAPGIVEAYRARGVPMESDFIAGTRLYPHPDDKKYIRVLILQGQEAEQIVRIAETITKFGPGDERVDSVRVMAADKVVLSLNEGHEPAQFTQSLNELDYRLLRPGGSPDTYVIQLNARKPESVQDAIDQIRTMDGVQSVEPYYLDTPADGQ